MYHYGAFPRPSRTRAGRTGCDADVLLLLLTVHHHHTVCVPQMMHHMMYRVCSVVALQMCRG